VSNLLFIVAPDSFKGSLTAIQAAESIARGIKSVFPRAKVLKIPVADGGEGTVECLVHSCGGEIVSVTVTGPLGKPIESFFGLLGDGSVGVVEVAAACGLPLVPEGKRNPLNTTSYGAGELIKAVLARGCRRLIVGLGGSATNDGGYGLARALGVGFLDSAGKETGPSLEDLLRARRIDPAGTDRLLRDVSITAACDVSNPLLGPNGSTAVFGAQKGATPEMIPFLESVLAHLASLTKESLGIDVAALPGAGAAGGLGAGMAAFAGACLKSGAELVLEMSGLEKALASGKASLVITGEGEVNAQTLQGKAPLGVAKLAKKYSLPVVAMAGSIASDAERVYEQGIDALFTILPGPRSRLEAMSKAGFFLEKAAARMIRLWEVGWKYKT
jgi:glycerate kinase